MNDDARNRPDDDGSDALEFLNKEPHDMSDRDDYEDGIREDETPDLNDDAYAPEDDTPPARRRGLSSAGGSSRVMIAASVVVVAAALFIFWPRGGGEDLPPPVGEQVSVVAQDSNAVATPTPARPRSSDVNLSREAPEVVPETPDPAEGGTTTPAAAPTRAESGDGNPGEEGVWAIQIGSFGSRQNALDLAAKLRADGLRVETPTLQSTTGGSSTKVWIAYFRTHAEAKTWAAAHADEIGGSTYITHR